MLFMRAFLVVFFALAVWSVIAPRSQWQLLSSWQYRHPEANEPSDASHMLTRVGGVAAILFGLFMWHLAGKVT
ncbi:hypothetical protein SAMN05421678_12724 [Actinopolymorpha cephalotaxi]|uniref:DUF6199 domain-containing protein n=1 Tax=Actinopolymorpha cephalotaxi TaxID=504797 RepID=A0A1I3BVU5_9ACTN|nr:DUF6199 family natural product biosynthesis protein [Actinopolymorpha cephalotaxi]NYH86311.1 hypothetical protein [Actinopolymorpha cephalotaxi]SFH66362.1 hypothetical protein SAMN05421678_12724 [Actinopolymorpha cephalotaxi]